MNGNLKRCLIMQHVNDMTSFLYTETVQTSPKGLDVILIILLNILKNKEKFRININIIFYVYINAKRI